MDLNRREFLASTTAMATAAAAAPEAHAQGGRTYKACIIGDSQHGGYGHYLHLAFALRDDVTVVGLADSDEAGRTQRAAQSGAQRTYADYREMLEKEGPDLVAIGPRWSVNHKDYLLACAEAGAHGLIEKPLSVDLEEADAMVDAIEARNLKWAIAFNARATPIVTHLKKLLRNDGLIGTILDARGRGKEDRRAGGEDLIVLGAHVFDMMAYLMDAPPQWCFADVTHGGRAAAPGDVHDPTEPLGPIVGDRIHATYGFGAGAIGRFDTMKNPDGNGGRFGLDLYGSRGIVTVRIDAVPTVYWLDEPSWAPGGRDAAWKPLPGVPDFAVNDHRERNKPIVDDLMAAIQEDRKPAISLQDGRVAQEMIQAVFESCVQGARVPMPLEHRSHPLKRWA